MRASINKRLVQGTHVLSGETMILTAPDGNVIHTQGNMVSIITDEGYTCTQCDVLGAVSIYDDTKQIA